MAEQMRLVRIRRHLVQVQTVVVMVMLVAVVRPVLEMDLVVIVDNMLVAVVVMQLLVQVGMVVTVRTFRG
jgi:hypothetical protein